MKAIALLFLVAFSALFPGAQAQTAGPKVDTYVGVVGSGDTLTNGVTKYKLFEFKEYYSDASVQVIANKVSGTPTGKFILYFSNDGTNFYRYPGGVTGGDSLVTTNTAGVQGKFIPLPSASKAKYIKMEYTTASTGVSRIRYKVWAVRPGN